MPGAPPLRCQDAVELVTDYLEAALTPAVRARLEDHLAACRNCVAYVAQLRAMVGALARVAAPTVDRAARSDLVALYRQWVPV